MNTIIAKQRLVRLIELLSEEIVKMGLYWRGEDVNIDNFDDPVYPALRWRLEYSDYFVNNCTLSETGLVPFGKSNETPLVMWKYILLCDCGTADGKITRSHPEEPFKASSAFDGKIYTNWIVKFFDTEQQAENYAKKSEYEKYVLYKGFDKIRYI